MDQRNNGLKRGPLRIVSIYALIGSLWILFSDQILIAFVRSPLMLTTLQTLKGWIYVLLTAVILYFLVRRDMHALRHYEETIENERKRFYELLEELPVYIYLLAPDHTIRFANRYFRERFGEFKGRFCHEVLYRRDEPCENCRVARVFEDRKPKIWEWDDAPQGRTYEVYDFPFTDVDGALLVLEMGVDVTDRKLAEEALKNALKGREELERIVNLSPATAWLWRNAANWPIEFVSGNVRRMGYDPEDFLSGRLAFSEIVHPEDLDRVEQEVKEYSSEPERGSFSQEYRVLTKSGDTRWIHDRTWIQRDEKGDIIYFRGILLDITDQKHLEDQFRHAQKMEAVGQLAGGVAHDFNNLLTPVMGYSEMMLSELGADHSHHWMLTEIQKAGQRATELARQLLAFSRKQVMEFRTLDLNDVVEGFEGLLRRMIREDIDIRIDLAPSLGNVKGDSSQVEQVLMNLAVNAQDAMPDGGTLTIETENAHIGAAYARKHSDVHPGPHVMLTLSDTGLGMDSETLQHIFEPFFTTKAKDRGTGLGLAMVYGIVKQHGGGIRVDSESGKGTTFKIYLPRVDEPADALPANSPDRQSQRGVETVVVVEDNPMVRELAMNILRKNGYHVIDMPGAKDCVRFFEDLKEPVHLLLTDVIMPEMNGKELYQKVSAIRPNLKVLYMSGYTADVIAHHGVIEKGINFIQKPFAVEELRKKVRQVLDEQ